MTRSSEDIEREVESARDDLDRTVEALKDKMTPGQLIDEVSRSFKGGGAGDLLGNLGGQVRENPMALAMIGAGMAWLMMGRSPQSPTYSAAHAYQSASGAAPSPDALTEGAHSAAGMVGEAGSRLKDAAGEAAGQARHSLQELGDGAGAVGRKAARTFEDILQQEPLIVGAVGLAVGVAIGAAFPSTALEDRTFGAARDDLINAGGEKLAAVAESLRGAGEASAAAAAGSAGFGLP